MSSFAPLHSPFVCSLHDLWVVLYLETIFIECSPLEDSVIPTWKAVLQRC